MKKFWNFIVIGVLGGVFGLQEFYLDRTAAGTFAVLFWWTCIPAIVAFIEVMIWLFRGEEEFNKKYNVTEDKVRLLD